MHPDIHACKLAQMHACNLIGTIFFHIVKGKDEKINELENIISEMKEELQVGYWKQQLFLEINCHIK